jgi:hypothetical protein
MESAAYWEAQEKAWAVTLKVGHSLYEEEKWVAACGNAAMWKKRVDILSANADAHATTPAPKDNDHGNKQ